MRIMSSPPSMIQETTERSSKPSTSSRPSADEIRAKVEAARLKKEGGAPKKEAGFRSDMPDDGVDISQVAKDRAKLKAKEVEAEGVKESEATRESDVGINRPDDPATHGKLKDVLTKGAFHFSGKEREILEKILQD